MKLATWLAGGFVILAGMGGLPVNAQDQDAQDQEKREQEKKLRAEEIEDRANTRNVTGFRPQPGKGTGSEDQTLKFNMSYFVGDWTFEWLAPDSPLGEGGEIAGTESVRRVLDGRFYEITIQGEGPQGPFTGNGILFYLDTPAGQYVTRHEVTRGLALIKTGPLGGDLGGTYGHFWETPSFQQNGSTIQLKGRTYMTSPAAYRVNTQIAIDGDPYQNFGSVFYTKQLGPELTPPPRPNYRGP